MKALLLFCIFICPLVLASAETPNKSFKVITLEHQELNTTSQQLFAYLKTTLEGAGIKNIERVEAPSARMLSMADQGKVDALLADSSLTLSSFGNLVKSSFPYLKLKLDIVYLKSNQGFDHRHIERYLGASLLNRPEVEDIIKKRRYKLYQTQSVEQALKMLVEKRVDYIIMTWEMLGGYFEADPKLKSQLGVAKDSHIEVNYYFVVNKRHLKLLPAIEKSLIKSSRNLSKFPSLESIIIKY